MPVPGAAAPTISACVPPPPLPCTNRPLHATAASPRPWPPRPRISLGWHTSHASQFQPQRRRPNRTPTASSPGRHRRSPPAVRGSVAMAVATRVRLHCHSPSPVDLAVVASPPFPLSQSPALPRSPGLRGPFSTCSRAWPVQPQVTTTPVAGSDLGRVCRSGRYLHPRVSVLLLGSIPVGRLGLSHASSSLRTSCVY